MGRKDEPDAYNRRIFRFCAGWLERVMQTIAEAAWLLQSNRWAFWIFGPRYFSAKSFGAQGWGPVRRGVGVAQADGVRTAGKLSASWSLFPRAGLVTLISGADQ